MASLGFEAPSDWGYAGYEYYDDPQGLSYDLLGGLGTGIDPSLFSYGLNYDTLPISGDSYLSPYTLPYSASSTPGIWGSIQAGNYSDAFNSAYNQLGGLRGVASLGLGGLSLLGNYLAKKDAEEMAKDQFDRTLGFKEKELATTSNTDLAKVDAMMNLLSQRGRVELDPRRYAEILASGQIPADMMATQQRIDVGQKNYARGGAHYGRARQGALGLLRGGSPGQMDDVNAALSHGEYVMDADVVAALGDGNTEAGAQRLDEMREAIRRHKRSAPVDDIPPPARHPLAYLKGVK